MNGKILLVALATIGLLFALVPTAAFAGISVPTHTISSPTSSPAVIPGQELGNVTILQKQMDAAKMLVNSAPAGIVNKSVPLPIQIASLNKTVSFKIGNQTHVVRPSSLPTTTGNRFIVTLNSFEITDTRAAHEDTDTATVTARIDNNQDANSNPKNTVYVGNVNNGVHPLNLAVGPFTVNSGLSFNYAIVNHHADSEQDIFNTVSSLATAAASAYYGQAGGMITSTVAKLVGAIFPGLVSGGCDGGVVADSIPQPPTSLSINDINNLPGMAQTGSHTETRHYPGYDSPWGCGSNSNYYLTWTITRVP
jgi:hypothetical protein